MNCSPVSPSFAHSMSIGRSVVRLDSYGPPRQGQDFFIFENKPSSLFFRSVDGVRGLSAASLRQSSFSFAPSSALFQNRCKSLLRQQRLEHHIFVRLGGNPRRDQRWSTFLKNHAAAIIACDFFVVASATFRIFYVLVVMEHTSGRIIHLNVTSHPTAAWTLQQLREAIPSDHTYRFILHDHDAIYSTQLDASVAHMGLEVIKTPVRSPQANSLCERLIGTLRRECLDWIIPI